MSARIAGSHFFSIAEALLAVVAVYSVEGVLVVAVVFCGGGSGPKNGFSVPVSCIGAMDKALSLCEAGCIFLTVDFFEFPGPGMINCGDNAQQCSVGLKDSQKWKTKMPMKNVRQS